MFERFHIVINGEYYDMGLEDAVCTFYMNYSQKRNNEEEIYGS
jgi:hypothetical protein